MTDFLRALQKTAHSYGLKRLAFEMDIPYNTLRNALNPTMSQNHLHAEHVCEIFRITQDHTALHVLCEEHGYTALPIKSDKENADSNLFFSILLVSNKHGDFFKEIDDALSDHRLTESERQAIKQKAISYQAAISSLLSKLDAMVEKN